MVIMIFKNGGNKLKKFKICVIYFVYFIYRLVSFEVEFNK